MAKRAKGLKPKIDKWQDYSKDLGLVMPEDLIAAAVQAGVFVYDLETTGLSAKLDRIEGVAFYVPPLNGAPRIRAWYPFVPHTFMCYDKAGKLTDLRPAMDQDEVMERLRPLFLLEDIINIAQNRKFDDAFLYYASGTQSPMVIKNIPADAMLADFCADERRKRYGLKHRVKQEFGHQMTTYNEAVRGQSLLAFCNAKPLGVYAMDDCIWTYRHHERALAKLRQQTPAPKNRTEKRWSIEKKLDKVMGKLERIYWGIDTRVSEILMEMEQSGVLIDWRWLREVDERLKKEQEEVSDRIEKFLGWPLNANSGKQVSDALFAPPPDGLGLPTAGIPVGASGDLSTADKVIKHFSRFHPLVSDILRCRSIDTVLTAFVKKLIKLSLESPDGRVYGHFNQTRTVIARLSSSSPINFQNQPREKNLVRKAYCAHRPGIDAEGMLLYGADFSQIELRVAAHLAQEDSMIEVYQMGGICTENNGGPCNRYQWWECHDCDHCAPPVNKQGVQLCSKCNSPKIEHQARCRHVDLHQRTAEDAGVDRNPLAKCLDGSTLVLGMQPGVDGRSWMRPITIEEMVGDIEPGEHRKVPISTLATGRTSSYTASGQRGSTVARTALKRHKRPTKIIVTKRAVVIATEDHRFQAIGDNLSALHPSTPGYAHESGFSLVEAQHLEKGMKLPLADVANPRALEAEFHETLLHVDIKINPFTKEIGDGPATITMDEKWAYFAGIFHGDGCASGNACVITHGKADKYETWRETVRAACDDVGLPTSLSKDKRQLRLGSRVVRRYLQGMGLCKEKGRSGKKHMRVPWWVMQGGPKLIWSYLAGLFDTDGTIGKKNNGTASLTTKYPELAGQVALLLRWLGMPILVQAGFNKTYERYYYTIHVLGEGLDRFLRYCPMRFHEKVERLRERCATIKRKCAPKTDDVILVLDGGERTVYDVQVESEDHLYLQGGLIGHNNLNFGVLYRMGAPKFCIYADLFDADGLPRVAYAREVILRWHAAYPKIADFHERVELELMHNGWIAQTLFGRRRRLDAEARINTFRAVTQGIQFQVSGSAQDIMKTAMIRIFDARNKKRENARPAERRLWERTKILLQIHDEIILEGPTILKPEITEMIKTCMENVGKGHLRIPLAVDVKSGTTWDDVH